MTTKDLISDYQGRLNAVSAYKNKALLFKQHILKSGSNEIDPDAIVHVIATLSMYESAYQTVRNALEEDKSVRFRQVYDSKRTASETDIGDAHVDITIFLPVTSQTFFNAYGLTSDDEQAKLLERGELFHFVYLNALEKRLMGLPMVQGREIFHELKL